MDKNIKKSSLYMLQITPRIFFGILSAQFDKIMLGLIGSTEVV
jgi:hypothetical protein